MTIEIPTELLMNPWAWAIGYILISILIARPFKWFLKYSTNLGPSDLKDSAVAASIFWPIGLCIFITITIVALVIIIFQYIVGD